MISTFLSLFTAGTLMTNDVPAAAPHVMPWNENVLLEVTDVPEKNEKNIAPVIEAEAAIVVDLKNGLILYEKNIHEQLHIASLTKLMTTTIVLEENDGSEVATVSQNAANTDGTKIWLAQGEKITVENLLYAALIESANDSAVALAEHNAGSVEAFVKKMNKKAYEIGLYSTSFSNPTGLDIENAPPEETLNGNISTAYDSHPSRSLRLRKKLRPKSPSVRKSLKSPPRMKAFSISWKVPINSSTATSTFLDLKQEQPTMLANALLPSFKMKKETTFSPSSSTAHHAFRKQNFWQTGPFVHTTGKSLWTL